MIKKVAQTVADIIIYSGIIILGLVLAGMVITIMDLDDTKKDSTTTLTIERQ